MGPQSQYLETVLTCKGNYYAPDLHNHVDDLKNKLQQLIADDTSNLVLKKVEPWNSVRVTFNMPIEAARRLKELAERRDSILRELGILAVQIEGDRVISLTLEGKPNEPTEVVVSFPSDAGRAEATAGDRNEQHEQCILGQSEMPGSSQITIAAQDSIASSSNEQTVSDHDTGLIKQPLLLDGLDVPVSSSADFISPHLALIGKNNNLNVDNFLRSQQAAIGQLGYELHLFQQRFNSSDISIQQAQAVFAKPACDQTRLNSDDSRTVPGSAMLHANQAPLGRGWPRIEDRMSIGNNIASSSPLLVNLLKSPGSRHPQPKVMIPRAPNPDLYLQPGIVVPQKRKRSQQRTPKRSKVEWDCKASGEQGGSGVLSNAVGSSSLLQGGFPQGAFLGAVSIPGASGCSDLPGLVGNSSFPTSMARSSDSQSRHRYMINPYTGDLEEVDDLDENDADQWNSTKTVTEPRSESQTSTESGVSTTIGSANSSQSSSVSMASLQSVLPTEAGILCHSNSKDISSSTAVQNLFHDEKESAETTLCRPSNLTTGLQIANMPDAAASVGDPLKIGDPANSLLTSLYISSLNPIASMANCSKPHILPTIPSISEAGQLYPSDLFILAGPQFLKSAPVLPPAPQSNTCPQDTSASVTPKALSTSNLMSIGACKSGRGGLPLQTISSQLNNYNFSSPFHHFYSMTVHHNSSSIMYPVCSQSLGTLPSAIPSSVLPSETVTRSESKVVMDPTPALSCSSANAETLKQQIQNQPFETFGQTSRVLFPPQPVDPSVLTKLPILNQTCLSQESAGEAGLNPNASTRRVLAVDDVKSSVSGGLSGLTSAALSLQTVIESVVPGAVRAAATETLLKDGATNQSTDEPTSNSVSRTSSRTEAGEESSNSKLESNSSRELVPSDTFPLGSLSQDLVSLSIALGQNGRLPVVSYPLGESGMPVKLNFQPVGDGKGLLESLSKNSQAVATVFSDSSLKVADHAVQNTVEAKESLILGDEKGPVQAATSDLALPPDKAVLENNLDLPSTEISGPVASCAIGIHTNSSQILASSFPMILASDAADNRTLQEDQAAVTQGQLQDAVVHLPEHDGLTKATTVPGSFVQSHFPGEAESHVHKSAAEIHLFGKTTLAAGSAFVTTPSAAADRPIFTQQQLPISGSFSNLKSTTDILKADAKTVAVSPLQPVFHGPFPGSHLAWDSRLVLPFGGLKSLSIAGVTGSDNLHTSAITLLGAQSVPAVQDKPSCVSVAKPVVAMPSVALNSLVQMENEIAMDKDTCGIKETGEEDVVRGDASTWSSTDANGMSGTVGLQDLIAMQVPSSEQQISKLASCRQTSLPELSRSIAAVSESRSLESSDNAIGDAIRVSQSTPSSFVGQAARFAVFPETKLLISRESGHRKSSRSTDDSSPRSKATLTVAKLLEKAENAKLSMLPTNKLTDAVSSVDGGFRQSGGSLLLPFSESLASSATMPGEMSLKLTATSPVSSRSGFGNISSNCLSSKVCANLSINTSRGYSLMDANPLPITAPGYPHNLTESVQKVMQGVGLDTSPPPSPKPSASSRLSPAKFGGMLLSAVQPRSLSSISCVVPCAIASDAKLRDMPRSPCAPSCKVTVTNSIPDSDQTLVLPDGRNVWSDNNSDDHGQQKAAETVEQAEVIASQDDAGEDVAFAEVDSSISIDSVSHMTPTSPVENKSVEAPSESRDKIDVSLFCAVDHSYSALPIANTRRDSEESSRSLHDSFEDLPERLTPVEDSHDNEEVFDEITETLVNEFEDQDLLLDDMIFSEGIGTFDRLPVFDGTDFRVTEERNSERFAQRLQFYEEHPGRLASGCLEVPKKLSELRENTQSSETMLFRKEKPKFESSGARNRLDENGLDHPEFETIKVLSEDPSRFTGEFTEELETEEADVLPLESIGSLNKHSTVDVVKRSKDPVPCDKTDGRELGRVDAHADLNKSDCNTLENPMKNAISIRRSKNRKNPKIRERRGGRFIGIKSSPQELSDEVKVVIAVHDSEHPATEANDNESAIPDDLRNPCLDDSVKSFPPSGRMTTRSRGRKNPRVGENPRAGENTILAVDGSSAAGGWAPVTPHRNADSKLCENSRRIENPVLLRRSTRTLRKAETGHSGDVNNCNDGTKIHATRSRKRPGKDIRTVVTQPVRDGDRTVMNEITEEFQETFNSGAIPLINESNQNVPLTGEEAAVSKESKELTSKKSKT